MALEKSGAGAFVAAFITSPLAAFGLLVILSFIFLFTALLSGYISNNAVPEEKAHNIQSAQSLSFIP